MNATLPSASSLGSGLSASLKVRDKQSKVARIESLLSQVNFATENLPCLSAEANAPKIRCHWPLEKDSRNGSLGTPMDSKYSWNHFQARACFSLVLWTTPPWTADLAASRSARNLSLLVEGRSRNQRESEKKHEIWAIELENNHSDGSLWTNNLRQCWNPPQTTDCKYSSCFQWSTLQDGGLTIVELPCLVHQQNLICAATLWWMCCQFDWADKILLGFHHLGSQSTL